MRADVVGHNAGPTISAPVLYRLPAQSLLYSLNTHRDHAPILTFARIFCWFLVCANLGWGGEPQDSSYASRYILRMYLYMSVYNRELYMYEVYIQVLQGKESNPGPHPHDQVPYYLLVARMAVYYTVTNNVDGAPPPQNERVLPPPPHLPIALPT